MKCLRCRLLDVLTLHGMAIHDNRGYWKMTNLFVWLHGGKDYCGKGRKRTFGNQKDEGAGVS